MDQFASNVLRLEIEWRGARCKIHNNLSSLATLDNPYWWRIILGFGERHILHFKPALSSQPLLIALSVITHPK